MPLSTPGPQADRGTTAGHRRHHGAVQLEMLPFQRLCGVFCYAFAALWLHLSCALAALWLPRKFLGLPGLRFWQRVRGVFATLFAASLAAPLLRLCGVFATLLAAPLRRLCYACGAFFAARLLRLRCVGGSALATPLRRFRGSFATLLLRRWCAFGAPRWCAFG